MNHKSKTLGAILFVWTVIVTAPLVSCSSPRVPSIQPVELKQQMHSLNPPVILDVRTPREFSKGHVPGAINIPVGELENRLSELSLHKTGEVVVYCRSGRRTMIAVKVLQDAGFARILKMEGNMPAWESGGLPVEK